MLYQFVFEAVDQAGNEYRVTMERNTSFVPDEWVADAYVRSGTRSGQFWKGTRYPLARHPRSYAEFTPKPELKPRVARA